VYHEKVKFLRTRLFYFQVLARVIDYFAKVCKDEKNGIVRFEDCYLFAFLIKFMEAINIYVLF